MEVFDNTSTSTRKSSRTVKRKTASDFVEWNTHKSNRKKSPKNFKDKGCIIKKSPKNFEDKRNIIKKSQKKFKDKGVKSNKQRACFRIDIGLQKKKNDGTEEIVEDGAVKCDNNIQGNKHTSDTSIKNEQLEKIDIDAEHSEGFTKQEKQTNSEKLDINGTNLKKYKESKEDAAAADCTKPKKHSENLETDGVKRECEESRAENAEDCVKLEKHIEGNGAIGSKSKCKKSQAKKISKAQDEVKPEFQCTLCPKSLGSRDSFQKHMFRHTGKKPYVCDICSKSFSMKSYLNRHMCRHSEVKQFFCEICHKGFNRKTTLHTHLSSHTDEKNFACNQCGRTFKMKQSLKAHINTHNLEKMYVCHLCGKSFGCDRYLIQHMISHSDARSYKCKICEKLFSSKQTQQEHVRRHAKMKIEACDICSKRFYNKKELALHKRFHTNVTDFKCQVCSMYFKMKKSLDFHLSKMHGRNYPCKICGVAHSNKKALRSHVFREHRKLRPPRKGKLEKHETASFKRVRCSLCGLLLSNKYRLQTHMIKIHLPSKQPFNMTNGQNGKVVETVSENVLNVESVPMESRFSSNEKHIYTSPECEYFENGIKNNVHSITVENVNGDTDEILVIWKEKMTEESGVQHYEEGNQNVPNKLDDRSKGDYEKVFRKLLPVPDSNSDTVQTEEVYVIVNTEDGRYTSLNEKYENGDTDVYSDVAHEIIIQPENTLEVATQGTTEERKDFTSFRKLEVLGHVTEHHRNLVNDTVHISSEEGIEDAIRTCISEEVPQNTIQISTEEGVGNTIHISTEVPQNTVQISTQEGVENTIHISGEVNESTVQISTDDVEGTAQISTGNVVEISSDDAKDFLQVPSEIVDTAQISAESVNDTSSILSESMDTIPDNTMLEGLLPRTGTAEEFSNFETKLLSGLTKLRKFDGYAQFLNNVTEFVLRERHLIKTDTQN